MNLTANVGLKQFVLMDHKDRWLCHACRSKVRKTDNSNTPARPSIAGSLSVMEHKEQLSCIELPSDDMHRAFITQRRKTSKSASNVMIVIWRPIMIILNLWVLRSRNNLLETTCIKTLNSFEIRDNL